MLPTSLPEPLVTRTYFANGLIQSERQRVRTLAPVDSGGDFTRHDYTVGYAYDLTGRRTRLAVPAALAPVVGGVPQDTVRFAYDPVMAGLTTVTDVLGRPFTYGYDGRNAVTSLALPLGYNERFEYTLDGLLSRDSVANDLGATIRRKSFLYGDARGKVTEITDLVGFRDRVFSRYSGLGYVDSTFYVARRDTGSSVTWTTSEKFTYDALANMTQSSTTTNVDGRRGSSSFGAPRALSYQPLFGRLATETNSQGTTTFEYDSAGNTRFLTRGVNTNGGTREDRFSYYAADGRLRAADFRQVVQSSGFNSPTVMAFEEYRYDALGRRVLVRSRRQCDFVSPRPKGECSQSLIRRTVWDGSQELVEIQMPDSVGNNPVVQTESDTGFVALPPIEISGGQQYFDPNPFFGRVIYAHGGALDNPLSITRVDYTDNPQQPLGNGGQGASRWNPFTVVPIWNDRGKVDLYYFAHDNSAATPFCRLVNTIQRCVQANFPFAWFAYDRQYLTPLAWHGTLPEDKQDKTGTLYRRARYYEPTTGRFTQEDPIGLAGGLNLYGFAGGDPVNFSDPFGLCPWCIQLFNWWMTTGGPALARFGAAFSGLSLPSTSSSKAVATIAPEVLEDIVTGARAAGTRAGPQIFEAARRIGDLRLSQAAATEAVEKAVLKLGHDVGPKLTIDGVKYVLAKMAFGGKLDAVAVHAGGRITHAVFDPETLKLVTDLGPIAARK